MADQAHFQSSGRDRALQGSKRPVRKASQSPRAGESSLNRSSPARFIEAEEALMTSEKASGRRRADPIAWTFVATIKMQNGRPRPLFFILSRQKRDRRGRPSPQCGDRPPNRGREIAVDALFEAKTDENERRLLSIVQRHDQNGTF